MRTRLDNGNIDTAVNPAPSGFTDADLTVLNDLRTAALQLRRWSRAQFVHAPFADYLAAWTIDTTDAAPPSLTIARFKRGGSYVLTCDALVVGTGSNLDAIVATVHHILAIDEQAPALA